MDQASLQRSFRGWWICFLIFCPCVIVAFGIVFVDLRRDDILIKLQSQQNIALIEENIRTMPDGPRKERFEVILKELRAE